MKNGAVDRFDIPTFPYPSADAFIICTFPATQKKCLFQTHCVEKGVSLTNEGDPNIICTTQTFSAETSKPQMSYVFRSDTKAILVSYNPEMTKTPIIEGHNANRSQQSASTGWIRNTGLSV